MKIQCDACEGAAAAVVCCADEAALCAACDVEIHAANKLASKHQRLPLEALSAGLPRCDVCQEKAAFIFCVEDRALFCRDCDEPIHVPGTLSGKHQRYLATGIRVGFSSVCSANADQLPPPAPDHHAPHVACSEQHHHQHPPALAAAAVDTQQAPSPQFLPQGWAVDELLQFSDYESSDKLQKESPLGFRELEWFADIDLFHNQAPKGGAARSTAEVPELFAPSQAANDAAYYRPNRTASAVVSAFTGVRQSKKARVEIPDDDDYLIVPDLG
uniref:B box-type domain-containing protein n=1 Tax=Oryza brachyantha TaxID=4533 RepID=J3LEK8_ORYBR